MSWTQKGKAVAIVALFLASTLVVGLLPNRVPTTANSAKNYNPHAVEVGSSSEQQEALGETEFQMEPHLANALREHAEFVAALQAAETERLENQRIENERLEAERLQVQVRAEAERAAAQQPIQQTVQQSEPQPTTAPANYASVWDALAGCESNGDWSMNSGNGFYGGIQFMHSTWVNMGGRQWAEYPHQATREQQIEVATRLQAQYGWGQWPACSAKLGLR